MQQTFPTQHAAVGMRNSLAKGKLELATSVEKTRRKSFQRRE